MKELIFNLPEAIKAVSANDVKGMNYMKLSKKANKWKLDAWLVLKSQMRKQKGVMLKGPVTLNIVYFFKVKKGRDYDNYSGGGSTKWLIDTLKSFAFSGGDSHKNVIPKIKIIEGADETATVIRIRERR